ncbi:MAG TPA: CarD family transcriptional regulator, partial [Opitutaceae bacterium]|nr:CarD family transcriptional regulator [Opitutaceae bacterium]
MDQPAGQDQRSKHTGVCPPARAAVLATLLQAQPAPVWLIIVEESRAAEQLAEDLMFFHSAAGDPRPLEVRVFPESLADVRNMREAFAASSDRLIVLSKLRSTRSAEVPAAATGASLVIVSTPAALVQPVPALNEFIGQELTLARGQRQPFQALVARLRDFDYDSETVCEAPGQYAVRGGIIDVYPVTASQPCRLDFFGDDIEDIRALDPVTQRSGDRLEQITLAASPRLQLTPSHTGLADYLSPLTRLVFVEPAALEEAFSLLTAESAAPTVGGQSPVPSAIEPVLARCAAAIAVSDLDEASALFEGAAHEQTWDTESLAHHRRYPDDALVAHERLQVEEEARHRFFEQVVRWQKEGYAIALAVAKDGEEARTREILAADPALKSLRPRFLRSTINEGFRVTYRPAEPCAAGPVRLALAPDARGLVLVSETEILGRQRQRRPVLHRRPAATPSQIDQLLDFSELVEGDFVVHLQHGIAVFRGLAKIETAAGTREVISLEFDDKVTLHVPLQ